MAKKAIVTLTDEERAQLHALTKCGTVSARRLTRAHLLLQADAGLSDEAIAQALHMGTATVERMRKRFVEEGLEAALSERPRPGGHRKLNGRKEAYLIALACSPPPEGRSVGRCRCSRIHSWHSGCSIPLPRSRSGARSKKCPQAMAEGEVVYS